MMAKKTSATASSSKRGAAKPRAGASNEKETKTPAARPIGVAQSADPRFETRVTKQDRMLSLLSRSEGATVEEMMLATNWQQHSVRGFLAGTVKKKLGFIVNSRKDDGDVRRYHIEKSRGR